MTAGPVGMIPAGRRTVHHGPRQRDATGLQAVRLQEPADRVGHLLEAALADDQPVMRVGRERLVAGLEPVGEPLGVVER